MKVFCSVARHSSFIAAALELGISPAYVSKRISKLEQYYEVTLFHRTTRRVRISDQGELIYARARKILDDMEGMTRDMADSRRDPSGLLKVCSTLRLGRNHVGPILSILAKKYPKLETWLDLGNRRIDLIEEGFDIDIRTGEVNEPHLIAHHVIQSRRILCAAPEYLKTRGTPASVAGLVHHNCLLFRGRDQAFGVWRFEGPNGIESVKVTGNFGSNHSDLVRSWALEGHGIILLSDWDVTADLRSGRLVRILSAYSQRADVWAVTPARLAGTAKVRSSIDFLVEQLRSGHFALDVRIS